MKLLYLLLVLLVIFISGCVKYGQQSNTSSGTPQSTETSTPSSGEVNQSTQPPATSTQQPSTGETNTSSSQPQTYNIEISGLTFSPAELRIKAGDTVIWTNKDSVGHTVTSDSGTELDSSLLSQSQTYSHTFNQKGTFSYHCTPHSFMKGKVVVE